MTLQRCLRLNTDSVLQKQLPTLSILADIYLACQASSCKCERGFNLQNLIKTKTRNRLSTVHLDILMCVRLLSGPVDKFNFQKAYKVWYTAK